jgi:lipoyl(octanoyl) transferase
LQAEGQKPAEDEAIADAGPAGSGAIPGEPLGRFGGADWYRSSEPVAYPVALAAMEARVAAILAGEAGDAVWLLEHPPLYTRGTSAKPDELLDPRFPVFASGRGGRFTYHGPGQRVAYPILDLRKRGADVRAYVCRLEGWIIAALARLGVHGERRSGRIGIWVVGEDGSEAKIAALGVRVRRWISLHGIALNVAPDLDHFSGIVPCGLEGFAVTSLRRLGIEVGMHEVDTILAATFAETFAA